MTETAAERRARENADLIRRMKAGESLALVESKATWWPPRALTVKDPDEIARVYGAPSGTFGVYPISQAGYAALRASLGNTEPPKPEAPESRQTPTPEPDRS